MNFNSNLKWALKKHHEQIVKKKKNLKTNCWLYFKLGLNFYAYHVKILFDNRFIKYIECKYYSLYRGKAPAGSIGRGNYSGEWRIEGGFKSKNCMEYIMTFFTGYSDKKRVYCSPTQQLPVFPKAEWL